MMDPSQHCPNLQGFHRENQFAELSICFAYKQHFASQFFCSVFLSKIWFLHSPRSIFPFSFSFYSNLPIACLFNLTSLQDLISFVLISLNSFFAYLTSSASFFTSWFYYFSRDRYSPLFLSNSFSNEVIFYNYKSKLFN